MQFALRRQVDTVYWTDFSVQIFFLTDSSHIWFSPWLNLGYRLHTCYLQLLFLLINLLNSASYSTIFSATLACTRPVFQQFSFLIHRFIVLDACIVQFLVHFGQGNCLSLSFIWRNILLVTSVWFWIILGWSIVVFLDFFSIITVRICHSVWFN